MNKKIRSNSGITLATLVITIIVMLILATVSINVGNDLIKKSKVQTLETNMLTIQAKAKSYAEEIESKVWAYSDSKKETERDKEFTDRKMTPSATVSNEALAQVNNEIKEEPIAYSVGEEALIAMGLDEIQDEQYIVVFKKTDYKQMDVIYPDGVTYDGQTYYALSALQEKLQNE